MELGEFCKRISGVDGLTNAQKAAAILWWHDQGEAGAQMKPGTLARLLREHGLGNVPSTRLAGSIRRLKVTYTRKGKVYLRAGAGSEIQSWLGDALGGAVPEVPSAGAYLPPAVWGKTRGYIEKVCEQLNGCYQYGWHDAASVMLRRLIETLMIEAYEHLGRQLEIKGDDGEYVSLGLLIEKAVAASGLPVGRETKKALREVKTAGDRSAHNRRYNATSSDMAHLRDGVRVAVEDLVNIADLRRGHRG